jgi:hypothetical protein
MRNIILAAVLLLLAACEHKLPPKPAELNFAGPPYTLNVSSIRMAEDYVPRKLPPHVEYLFDVPPAEAIQQWVKARLVATGQKGYLEVDIRDASVIRKDLPKKETGLAGLFTKEQTEEYDGKLDMTLKIYNGHKLLPVANVHVTAQRTQTLREDATAEDRKALYRQMTADLMNDLTAELDKNIRQYFANYLMQ